MARPESHRLDRMELGTDDMPPGPVTASQSFVRRGTGPSRGATDPVSTSCDYIGTLRIEILRARDNRTPPEMLGFRLRVTGGILPDGLRIPSHTIRAAGGKSIALRWPDGATDDQEAFDFELGIVAVDLAGNEGPASTPVRLTHGGSVD